MVSMREERLEDEVRDDEHGVRREREAEDMEEQLGRERAHVRARRSTRTETSCVASDASAPESAMFGSRSPSRAFRYRTI